MPQPLTDPPLPPTASWAANLLIGGMLLLFLGVGGLGLWVWVWGRASAQPSNYAVTSVDTSPVVSSPTPLYSLAPYYHPFHSPVGDGSEATPYVVVDTQEEARTRYAPKAFTLTLDKSTGIIQIKFEGSAVDPAPYAYFIGYWSEPFDPVERFDSFDPKDPKSIKWSIVNEPAQLAQVQQSIEVYPRALPPSTKTVYLYVYVRVKQENEGLAPTYLDFVYGQDYQADVPYRVQLN